MQHGALEPWAMGLLPSFLPVAGGKFGGTFPAGRRTRIQTQGGRGVTCRLDAHQRGRGAHLKSSSRIPPWCTLVAPFSHSSWVLWAFFFFSCFFFLCFLGHIFHACQSRGPIPVDNHAFMLLLASCKLVCSVQLEWARVGSTLFFSPCGPTVGTVPAHSGAAHFLTSMSCVPVSRGHICHPPLWRVPPRPHCSLRSRSSVRSW